MNHIDKDILDISQKCPVCCSDDIEPDASIVRNVWDKSYTVSYCYNCRLYYLSKWPLPKEIKRYYENYYKTVSILFPLKYIFRNFRSASQYKYIIENISSGLVDKSILEVGSGDGILLSYFVRDNSVKGLDYSTRYKLLAKLLYNVEISNEELFDLNDNYDLILMSHVIEHFTDIHRVLKKISNILNSGGYLFIEVPYSPLINECESQELSDYVSTPHMYNFSTKSIQILLSQHNYEVVAIDRFFYNLHSMRNRLKNKELGRLFMGGKRLNLKNSFDIILYISQSLLKPDDSYRKIDLDEQYLGLGDSIRVIAKKA